jgi:hypothetical protein
VSVCPWAGVPDWWLKKGVAYRSALTGCGTLANLAVVLGLVVVTP